MNELLNDDWRKHKLIILKSAVALVTCVACSAPGHEPHRRPAKLPSGTPYDQISQRLKTIIKNTKSQCWTGNDFGRFDDGQTIYHVISAMYRGQRKKLAVDDSSSFKYVVTAKSRFQVSVMQLWEEESRPENRYKNYPKDCDKSKYNKPLPCLTSQTTKQV